MTIESLLVAACIIFLVTGVDGASGIHFASSYGDHMVLQGAPYRSVLWGFAHKVGDAVRVSLNNAQVATTTVTANHHGSLPGIWKVKLPVQHHKGPVSIQVSSSEGSATLHDVLFGDVWFCSGQSNMGFPMGQVFNNTEELKQAPSFTEIRTFQTALTTANTSHTDLLHASSWNLPSTGSLAGFSAVCWLYGKYLYPHIHRPIGLIESAWGGTPIESWSSHEALAACTHNGRRKTRAPSQPSVLWNAMVNPFVQMTIFGAIWYQGEANAGRADRYACQFSAMISDWRQKFHKGSDGETNNLFPFGFVQLSGFNNNFNNIGGFPDLRWAQTANYGFVPNAKLQNVFMAVAMDLPDFTSPYGPIHPRDKEDVASRLVFAGRAVAYGEMGLDVQGPFPSTFNIHGSSLVIEFNQGKSPIEVRSNVGFEVVLNDTRFKISRKYK
ncbi:hypothetical protein CHS0354_032663 [Potamilus streckersoni]|uniref:Sialate O-acetylesterase domain-containing protein n=1 Tax=Potamilus streckersoni TaxID=2493646 RepID=A0AAE0WC27_9BIVA|nr:hypothetical protein CHS0354_032663 [Potamilus streckersoni]